MPADSDFTRRLSSELLVHIFPRNGRVSSLLNCSQVSRRWHSIAEDPLNDELLWCGFCVRAHPSVTDAYRPKRWQKMYRQHRLADKQPACTINHLKHRGIKIPDMELPPVELSSYEMHVEMHLSGSLVEARRLEWDDGACTASCQFPPLPSDQCREFRLFVLRKLDQKIVTLEPNLLLFSDFWLDSMCTSVFLSLLASPPIDAGIDAGSIETSVTKQGLFRVRVFGVTIVFPHLFSDARPPSATCSFEDFPDLLAFIEHSGCCATFV